MTAGSFNSSSCWSRRDHALEVKGASSSDLDQTPRRTISDVPEIDELSSEDEVIPKHKRPRAPMRRLVSQDFGVQYISSAGEEDDSDAQYMDMKPLPESTVPLSPNPLRDVKLLAVHIHALRLESELFPMRQLVTRLMTNPQHNRRGIFNNPVDAMALGLADYQNIITKPMDLGTVKARLHAVGYKSCDECAGDVRLVFQNAMRFNPPENPVHIAALALLTLFNEQCEIMEASNFTFPTPVDKNAKLAPIQLYPSLPPRHRAAAIKDPNPTSCQLRPASTSAISNISRDSGSISVSMSDMLSQSANTPVTALATASVVTTVLSTVVPSVKHGKLSSVQTLESAVFPVPLVTLNTNPFEIKFPAKETIAAVVTSCPFAHEEVAPAGPSPKVKPMTPCLLDTLSIPSQSEISKSNALVKPTSLSGGACIFDKVTDTKPLKCASLSAVGGSIIKCSESLHRVDPGEQSPQKALKRAISIAAKNAKHTCRSCLGRACSMCNQGCLSHEPALLICTGANCGGAKIRKGATYYIAKDGSRQFCQRCYSNLQAVLPHTSDQFESMGTAVRYKHDLLKRRNDEEVAEYWLTCSKCEKGVHKICAMFNEFTDSAAKYICPLCFEGVDTLMEKKRKPTLKKFKRDEMYTFVSGNDIPVIMSDVFSRGKSSAVTAEDLPETPISSFIEEKVRGRMETPECPNAGKTVTLRIISDCCKFFKVPEVVRKHFRMQAEMENLENGVPPPSMVNYNSKAIMLFQKIDGLDVCIFCMYIQEYDGDDDYGKDSKRGKQKKRVYIAYLDSVEHFRPRSFRTSVYHEILVAYLATARARGYENVHIWACPPSRGNSFVFWNHPVSQRTPNKDRLVSWYHGVLSRAVAVGIVTDVKSLFESSFHEFMKSQGTEKEDERREHIFPQTEQEGVIGGLMICPPLLDGDFWIEEAVRVHASNINRFLKSKSTGKEGLSVAILDDQRRCPTLQIATFVRDTLMAHKAAAPFRKPVNAAAMKLKDYHKVITNPMDLGTVYSRCLLGEFETLSDVVSDVELVFRNAMKYNPEGHSVYESALESRDFFIVELNKLTRSWSINGSATCKDCDHTWSCFAAVSMSLDVRLETDFPNNAQSNLSHSIDILEMTSTSSFESQVLHTSADTRNINTTMLKSPSLNSKEIEAMSIIQYPLRVNIPSAKLRNVSPMPSPSSVRTNTLLENNLEFLTGGPDAILQRMVGEDVWLLDKRNQNQTKGPVNSKKNGKRKKLAVEDLPQKRRRQSWLGQEVGSSIRRLRTSFFTCSLTPKLTPTEEEIEKARHFASYTSSFNARNEKCSGNFVSPLADARHALLEFSQFRNLEFDTLRRAKFSTSILLYHLHNIDAPGLIPSCTSCQETIEDVRWHRVRRVGERHHSGRIPPTLRAQRMSEIAISEEIAQASHWGEELCSTCFKNQKNEEDFIPLPVSFKV